MKTFKELIVKAQRRDHSAQEELLNMYKHITLA